MLVTYKFLDFDKDCSCVSRKLYCVFSYMCIMSILVQKYILYQKYNYDCHLCGVKPGHCFLFVGEEEVRPGLCEQILDFFASLFRIINRSSYIGTNIIMMVRTFCLVLLA